MLVDRCWSIVPKAGVVHMAFPLNEKATVKKLNEKATVKKPSPCVIFVASSPRNI
jgi:hypothetical protein